MLHFVQRLIQDLKKLFHVERLDQVADRPSGEETFDLVRGGIGTEDDDRNVARGGVVAQLTQNFVALDIREMKVQEDHVGAVLTGQVDAQPSLAWRRADAPPDEA